MTRGEDIGLKYLLLLYIAPSGDNINFITALYRESGRQLRRIYLMKFKSKNRMSTETLALGAILTALVIVLQFIAAMLVRLGLFSVSLVLIPIVIGVATCGIGMGAWLGFVFGVVVLLSGDAAAFLAVDVLGTVVTVLVKGIACGLCAGLVYKLLEKLNRYVAVFAAAIICPVVNTGVFLIGGVVFFLDTLSEWGKSFGYDDVASYMFFGLVGFNFLFELGVNIVLSPIVVRLLNMRKTKSNAKLLNK